MNQVVSNHSFPMVKCSLALTGIALAAGAAASYGVPAGLKMLLGEEGVVLVWVKKNV